MSHLQLDWTAVEIQGRTRHRPVTPLSQTQHAHRQRLVQQRLNAHAAQYAANKAFLEAEYGQILLSLNDHIAKEHDAKLRASTLIVNAQPYFGGHPPAVADLLALEYGTFLRLCDTTLRRLRDLADDRRDNAALQRDHNTRVVAFDVATGTNAMTELERQRQMTSQPSQTYSGGLSLIQQANNLARERHLYKTHTDEGAADLEKMAPAHQTLLLRDMPYSDWCRRQGGILLTYDAATWAAMEEEGSINVDYQVHLDGFYNTLFHSQYGHDM